MAPGYEDMVVVAPQTRNVVAFITRPRSVKTRTPPWNGT